MSNYRVRQVLGLGSMPDRQFRLLVALATWMTDDTRVVRVGYDKLIEDTGNARNTVRTARRELEAARKLASQVGRGKGNLTVWTVLCLPETVAKGVNDVDPFSKGVSDVDPLTDAKGVNRAPQKGSTSTRKRGQPKSADLQEPDRWLNRRATTSGFCLSARAREAILAAVPDADDREIELFADEIEKTRNPGNLSAYIASFPAVQIAEAIRRDRHGLPHVPATPRRGDADRNESHSRPADAAEMLREIDSEATRDETAEVLEIIRQRPGVRDETAVLRAEIARGNGYNLLVQARHQMDKTQMGKWDPLWDKPQERPAQVVSGEVIQPDEDHEPVDVAATIAETRAKLAALNGKEAS